MSKAWNHFKTITYHKYLVMKGCFAVGLYKQGLMHDLSKYSPTEFMVGARYWQGDRSPNNAEREDVGFSSSWLHHKGRNKHHYEYWIDYNSHAVDEAMVPVPMPNRYIVEMFMDRLAASKVYNKEKYTDADALKYYQSGDTARFLHPHTKKVLELLLKMNAKYGEEKTFEFIRNRILKKDVTIKKAKKIVDNGYKK